MSDANEKLKALISHIHRCVELNENKRVSRKAMAARVGINYRTYTEYLRGVNSPLSMKALLNLLGMLEEQQLTDVIRKWCREDPL